jgi:hypothetical protein
VADLFVKLQAAAEIFCVALLLQVILDACLFLERLVVLLQLVVRILDLF